MEELNDSKIKVALTLFVIGFIIGAIIATCTTLIIYDKGRVKRQNTEYISTQYSLGTPHRDR